MSFIGSPGDRRRIERLETLAGVRGAGPSAAVLKAQADELAALLGTTRKTAAALDRALKDAEAALADLEAAQAALTGRTDDLETGQAALTTAVAGKADIGHTHVAANITDFAEALDDRVAALLVAGANITLTYDDAAGSLAIAAAGGSTPGPAGADGFGLPKISPVTGRFYDGGAFAATTTIAGAANRCELYPVLFSGALSIDQIGVAVSTAVASAQAKVVVYSATAAGVPNALLFESAALDCATTGFKQVAASLSFAANTVYWLGVHHSSTATVRGIPVAGLPSLGMAAGADTALGSILRRTVTFANAAPNPWNFVASEVVANGVAPAVRMRKA